MPKSHPRPSSCAFKGSNLAARLRRGTDSCSGVLLGGAFITRSMVDPIAAMDHSCTTRRHSPPFSTVRMLSPTSRSRPSVFATVRVGHICKQGVVGSSPIVSTLKSAFDQALVVTDPDFQLSLHQGPCTIYVPRARAPLSKRAATSVPDQANCGSGDGRAALDCRESRGSR